MVNIIRENYHRFNFGLILEPPAFCRVDCVMAGTLWMTNMNKLYEKK